MTYIRKSLTLILAINLVLLSSVIVFFTPANSMSRNLVTIVEKEEISTTMTLEPKSEGFYNADLHWIKTVLEMDRKGSGKVTIIINCTPSNTDHVGMYFRTIQSGEIVEVIDDQTYAIQDGQQFTVNHSASNDFDLSYRVYLENNSLIKTNTTLQYYFSYNANFFLSEQIAHYRVDTNLIVIDLIRPAWDADLECQELQIKMPIDVGEENVTSDFLDNIEFDVEQFMKDYYILSYDTESDSEGNYWLVFNCRKNAMPARGSFEAKFYVSTEHFSLPKVFNWLVILLVSLFVTAALVLFLVVINVRNKSKEEVTEFKEELYKLLATEET